MQSFAFRLRKICSLLPNPITAGYLQDIRENIGVEDLAWAKLVTKRGVTLKIQSFLTGKINQKWKNEVMSGLSGRRRALFLTQQATGAGKWINGVPSKESALAD